MKTTKQVLIDARALVKKGWIQGAWRSKDNSCHCAAGAIRAQSISGDKAFRALNCLQKVTGGDVVMWNDTKGRTKREVLKAFTTAIASCR